MKVVDIFIAYSHRDLSFKNELKKILRPLLHAGKASLWDDYDIEAGKDWETEIKKRLHSAEIILLLVSPDSLDSDYFYGEEVTIALERHAKGEATVVPIILRHCLWHITPLGTLEALPEKGKAVASWVSQDEAMTNVALRLLEIVEAKIAEYVDEQQENEQLRTSQAFIKPEKIKQPKIFVNPDEWKKWLDDGEHDRLFDTLIPLLLALGEPGEKFINRLTLIIAQWRVTKKDVSQGFISSLEFETTRNIITSALIDLLEDIKAAFT